MRTPSPGVPPRGLPSRALPSRALPSRVLAPSGVAARAASHAASRAAASLACAALALAAGPAAAQDLERYREPAVAQAIARVTREAILARLAHRPYAPPDAAARAGDRAAPAGVFVTLSKAGVTRGCWGTVEPRQGSLAQEVAINAAHALTFDYRHTPIRAADLAGMVAHVSIVGELEPVAGPAALQPRRYGLLVSGGGKGGVLLPGEAATAAWQVYTCRRKAGLGPRERATLYRFRTAVIGPIALAP